MMLYKTSTAEFAGNTEVATKIIYFFKHYTIKQIKSQEKIK